MAVVGCLLVNALIAIPVATLSGSLPCSCIAAYGCLMVNASECSYSQYARFTQNKSDYLDPDPAWLQYGCLVVNAPTANTVAAAEHGIALLCALSRNVAQADASVKRGEWKRSKYTGVSLVGKTLAIMGFGKVC